MRVAVVTGASSGIGAALCKALKADGWHVVGLSRSAAPAADEYQPCDVGDPGSIALAATAILERHPKLDLLVNNAGVGARESFLKASPEVIEQVMRTNYFGSVWMLRALLPGLEPGAHLVNIVSVAGLIAVGPYSASKHAQLGFSRSVAGELSGRGINVLTVNPGFVETPGFPQKARFKFGLYRLVATPDLVASRIMDGIAKNRREIIVPRWYRPVVWAQVLAPGLFSRALGRSRAPGA